MSSIVDEGNRLLAAQAELEAYQAAEEARMATVFQVADNLNNMFQLLNVLIDRLQRLEALVVATRVRKPIRDETGTILYVVDEMQPPNWARPTTTVGDH